MKQLFAKYKYECITAGVCGSLCLGVLVAPWVVQWRLPIAESDVVVYQTRTGKPLVQGSSVRNAVETQLNRFRAVVARLEGVDLETAEWTDISAKLAGASRDTANAIRKLSGSLYAADLSNADLHGLDFRGIALQHADFTGSDLSYARLDGGQLGGSCFARANLSGATLGTRQEHAKGAWPAGGNAPGAQFQGCDFGGETLIGRFSGASFRGANLHGATLQLWNCQDLDFSDADLTDGLIELVQTAVPGARGEWDSANFYATVKYNEGTRTRNLRLTGVTNPDAPFVLWAIAHGAVLYEAPLPSG